MILTLLSWLWIGVTAFLCGFAVLQLKPFRKQTGYRRPHQYILMGLCILTVYAQFFSLFGKVSMAASIGVLFFCIFVAGRFWKEWKACFRQIKADMAWYQLLIIAGILFLMLGIASLQPIQYDTDLYHAQSIRWIEEYGVIKGLGNLHNRFAYNSSFFCLQALYSLKWLVNQSLHSLNGFIAVVMLSYSFTECGIFRKKKITVSDIFRLCIIWYLCLREVIFTVSSSGSDILAQTLFLYLCAEWSRLAEEKADTTEYGILCVLAVWAITVKLSVAVLILFAVYPAIQLIRKKQWKMAGLFAALCLLTAVPFLARNVMISGYLLYPYEKLDLFSVDWKMPASVARFDSAEIKAWGRGITELQEYGMSFRQWVPLWYHKLQAGYQLLIGIHFLCIPAALFYTGKMLRQRRDAARLLLLWISIAGLVVWFFTSPLIRYGVVYLLLLPAFFVELFLERLQNTNTQKDSLQKKSVGEKNSEKKSWERKIQEKRGQQKKNLSEGVMKIALLFLGCMIVNAGKQVVDIQGLPPVKRAQDYAYYDVAEVELDGEVFYTGIGTDCVGYQNFPSIAYEKMQQFMELRTGKLEDGFRVREEYQSLNLSNSGQILSE